VGGCSGRWVLVLSSKACKFIWQRYGDPVGGIITSSQESNGGFLCLYKS